MLLMANQKNAMAKPIKMVSGTQRLVSTCPLARPRVSFVADVKGTIQLRRCTSGGKASRGKKTPLKKNIGVMIRVKK